MQALINRYRANYKLTVLHKAAIIVLLTLGIFFLMNPDVYRLNRPYNPDEVYIPFLKAGDYEIKIIHNGASAGNYAVASSELVTDSENHMGVEFARTPLREGIRDVAVLNVHLEQGTFGVRIWQEKPEQCFEEVNIQRVQLLDRDHYFMFAICVLSALCIALLGWYVPVEKYKRPLFLIGIGLAASLPIYSDFLLHGHDLVFHLARLEGLYQGLRSGAFPVRLNPMQSNLFGNLTASMYPQLFLYPVVIPRFFDVSVILCYKILVVCMNVAAAMLTFYGVKRITGSEKMAYIASVLYTFSFYRLIDTYLRAAVGEALAMVFLPLALWGIYEILMGEEYRKKWYLLTLGVTCVLQSHLMSAVMAVFFLGLEAVAWLIVSLRGKMPRKELLGRIGAGIIATLAACLLNAGFLVPFLFFRGEKLLCFALDYYVADFELYFSQMFSLFPSATGEVVSMGSTKDEMPLTVGGILAVGAILFLIAVFREKKQSKAVTMGMHCLVGGGISLLLTSWLVPWERMGENEFVRNLMTPLQFSWRFLGIASLCLCVTSAVGVVMFVSQMKGKEWILGVYMAVALCGAWFFFDSMMLQMDSINDEMDLEGNTEFDSLYLYDDRDIPDELQCRLDISENYVKTLNGTQVRYSDYQKTGTKISLYVTSDGGVGEEYLIFPLYYYPGYEILVDGQKVEDISQNRLLACRLPAGEAYIQVAYKGMTSWRVADIISLIMTIGIAVYAVKQRMPEKKGIADR